MLFASAVITLSTCGLDKPKGPEGPLSSYGCLRSKCGVWQKIATPACAIESASRALTAGDVWCRVGNGINWKGQVFPKMNNFTAHNRMTGVGNALKRHYTMYLLEYEQVQRNFPYMLPPIAPSMNSRRLRLSFKACSTCIAGQVSLVSLDLWPCEEEWLC